MKKLVAGLALCLIFLCMPSWAAFPEIPNEAAVHPVEHFNNVALMYAWMESGSVYVGMHLVSEEFYVCGLGFKITQSGNEITDLQLVTATGEGFCGVLSADRTLQVQWGSQKVNAALPLTLHFTSNDFYEFDLVPLSNPTPLTAPPVGDDAKMWPVAHFNDLALLYAWAVNGVIHVYMDLLTDCFYVCGSCFEVTQGDVAIGGLSLLTEAGAQFCGSLVVDKGFTLKGNFAAINMAQPFTLKFTANKFYYLTISSDGTEEPPDSEDPPEDPVDPSVMPRNGFWRGLGTGGALGASQTTIINLYVQKYENESVAIVATVDGKNNVLFLGGKNAARVNNENYITYTDGFEITNDVGSRNYRMKMILKDSYWASFWLDTGLGYEEYEIGLVLAEDQEEQ